MRWFLGGLMMVALAGFAAPSHALAPQAATTAVQAAGDATSVTQEAATRRRPARRTRARRPAAPVTQ